MTDDAISKNNGMRQRWLSVLARANRVQLEQALEGVGPLPELAELVHVRPSEIGMVMLRGRVGGTGDAFNLGEASVTRCALRIGSGSGDGGNSGSGAALGVGYTLGRDHRKAELIAIFDALLQDTARHEQLQQGVINPLALQQRAMTDVASSKALASKVEFFTFVRGEA